MKILFDQNISHRVISKISDAFPEIRQIIHVKDVGLFEANDFIIWEYAKNNDYCIITQDDDFTKLYLLKGYPPKIIWLRAGNVSNDVIAETLIDRKKWIIQFLIEDKSSIGLLEIYKL
jgi:predicted nuclease of predicted toxin-antitoxin system